MSEHDDTNGEQSAEEITEPVEIAELPGEEAILLAGRLRADGIPATVYPDDVSTATSSFGLAPLRQVLVPKEFAEQARETAAPFLEGTGDGDS
jgi:hypothetical protein